MINRSVFGLATSLGSTPKKVMLGSAYKEAAPAKLNMAACEMFPKQAQKNAERWLKGSQKNFHGLSDFFQLLCVFFFKF